MAKKIPMNNPRRTRQIPVLSEDQERSEGEGIHYREMVRDIISSPGFKYIAGGLAAAILARLASNVSEKYPEISDFIKENMDMLQGKLDEYKSHLQSQNLSAKH